MSLDGIVINGIVNEIKSKLINGKIDKVYQPESDEILLNIRNNGENLKLLISASSNNPRIYLTSTKKSNPAAPPMFCMLLRKHLQGGRIISINQPSLERIINIEIQTFDELGVLTTKSLTVEIMGRHSNIILWDKSSEKIIDSIKRITPDISSIRIILPGVKYDLPPSQDKLNPLFLEKESLIKRLSLTNEGELIYKFIYKNYMGISPLIAREICYAANLDTTLRIGEMTSEDKENLIKSFNAIMSNIKSNKYFPNMVVDNNIGKVMSFSVIDINQYKLLTKKYYDTISTLLEDYYQTRDNLDRIKQKSISLRKNISNKLDRALKKLSKQRDELLTAQKREKYKIFGDLITANIYRIEKGLEEIEVENFYSEDYETINIKLDVSLSPSQNAQKYFKKYNKLKNAYKFISNEIIKTKEEVDYLEHVLISIDNCTSLKDLDDIKEELISEGYHKGNNKNKKRNISSNQSSPRQYISKDGYDIYVGKNNKQNDYLTIKFASKDDIWLHTKDIPGSHVIIKNKGEEIPPSTIKEAALLAAYYSKGNLSSNVPVDYTERKNVKKPKGAKLGMVTYENNNTIYVTPSQNDVSKIKEVK